MPLAPDRYEIRFTASAALCEKLRLAKDLLRHAVPSGDTAEIVDRALTALLKDLARKKFAAVKTPRVGNRQTAPDSRYTPADVKRAVWLRDGGRCAFVSKCGRRCGERAFLEFHHVRPYAAGGEATVKQHRASLPSPQHLRVGAVLRLGEELVPEQVGARSPPQGAENNRGVARTTNVRTSKVTGSSLCTVITIWPRLLSASAQVTTLPIGTPA